MRYFCFRKKKSTKSVGIVLAICFGLVILSGILMIIPSKQEGDIYDNVIRFHVIANSDSTEDQVLKLELRDAVIENYSDILKLCKDKKAAEVTLDSITDSINEFAHGFIKEKGFDYTCDTTLDKEYYNRIDYQNFSMPEGNYTSLRIKIGDGKGQNWWCVLFPPLCTQAALGKTSEEDYEDVFIEAGFTGEQYRILTENDKPKYRLKFRLIELLFGN